MQQATESPGDFHALRRRIRLTGVLETVTALRVGGGQDSGLGSSDLPVLRDAEGYPLIPGASLKGVVRSIVEALVRASHQDDDGLWSCDPLSDDSAPVSERACGWHREGDRAAVKLEGHCSVCRLFGSQVLASHVRFSDAIAIDRDLPPPIEVRDGVAIDRDLRRVAGAQKFDFEVVSPGTKFAIEFFADNPQDWQLGLLLAGFDQLTDGFAAVGGFTSRGLGRVSVSWHEMTEVTARELLSGKLPTRSDGPELQERFSAWREALGAFAGSAS